MKHFNKYLPIAVALSALFVFTSNVFAAGEEDDAKWKAYAEERIKSPLRIGMNNDNGTQEVDLVEIEDGQLIFRMAGLPGEGSMPLDSLGEVKFDVQADKDFFNYIGLVGNDTFSRVHLNTLRKYIYPMVRFVAIPPKHVKFKSLVTTLGTGLLQLDQINEAYFLFNQVDLSVMGPEFEKHSVDLARKLVATETYDKAIRVIERLPVERFDDVNLGFILKLAHTLRDHGEFRAARDIYLKVAVNPNVTDNSARYWAYYCELRESDFLEQHRFDVDLPRVEAGEDSFPLQQLILCIFYQKRDQHDKAMRAVSEGIAYATPVESWTPELMYRSAEAYESLDMKDISQSVYKETSLFFPNSLWAEKAQQHLNCLN